VPLVEYLRFTYGCQVEVIAFGKSSSGQLREAADDFVDICENPRDYLIGYGGRSARWIPGLGGKEEESIDTTLVGEPDDEPTDNTGEGEDPAIKMSGE
ncbi:MAG: hypothetical protein JWO43_388, partial [Candidatus Adlerbacteria bacterium]|nr:hypothetical protein [Candidatus Adlerbacteria bacterium]